MITWTADAITFTFLSAKTIKTWDTLLELSTLRRGVQVLQPIILALFGMQLVLWLCLPRIGRKKD